MNTQEKAAYTAIAMTAIASNEFFVLMAVWDMLKAQKEIADRCYKKHGEIGHKVQSGILAELADKVEAAVDTLQAER